MVGPLSSTLFHQHLEMWVCFPDLDLERTRAQSLELNLEISLVHMWLKLVQTTISAALLRGLDVKKSKGK